jgi:hypothetical protein
MAHMEGKYTKKILTYRRAAWLNELPGGATFETCLRQALAKLQTVGHTAIVRDSGQEIKCLKREIRPRGGVCLHITAVTPGGEASIISRKGMEAASELDVGTVTPPPDNDFMDGDVFIFVRNNSLCICSNQIHDGTIRSYFFQLFGKAKLSEDTGKFDIVSVADLERVKFIHDHGIKSITLNAALYKASSDLAHNVKRTRGVAGVVAKFLNAMVGKEHDVTNDSIMVTLTVETDGRVRKHLGLGEQRLEHWAVDLVTHEDPDDNYVIKTKDNQFIRPKELKVQKLGNILVKGNSVDRDDAWKELLAFYGDLCDKGAIEE